jgi:23S rRNA pseudouridine1911/1915/1917 synthase
MAIRLKSLPWSGGDVQIVYEDDDLIVCNKPSGLLTVPIPKSAAENLYTMLREYVTGRGKIALTVHRIDRYTTGLVVFAKHKTARHSLVQQFLAHRPIRVYHALVRGVVKNKAGELVHRLKQVKTSFKNIIAAEGDPDGAIARCTYRVIEQYPKAALVEIHLDTGFKNQIRAQFSIIGHPLVGDIQYGKKRPDYLLDRQALHAYRLTFVHPRNGKPITFQADYPADFQAAIEKLKSGAEAFGVSDPAVEEAAALVSKVAKTWNKKLTRRRF